MPVELTRLANGIHVITHHMPQLETAALGIWVRAGARDESPQQNGIAHFLEHMAFKGTRRRTAAQIAEEIESAGGDINAATAMENTAYYARVLKEDWLLALDILTDILTDPLFDEQELERERDVILQEIAAAGDTPDDLVFDLSQGVAFPDHPLGRPILGTSDLVSAHRAGAIGLYRASHYSAGRIVVAAAGHVDHAALCRETERRLGHLPVSEGAVWDAPKFAGGPALAERPLDQTHLVFGFPAASYRDEAIHTLQVLSGLLGGGMSSRLFQEVRERRGLCYSVFCFGSSYQDSGLLSVYAATAPGKARKLTKVLRDVMISVADGVGEAEIQRSKAQLKAGLVMSLESASGRADQIARQYLAFGRVPEVSEIIAKIEAVTGDDVRNMAGGLFHGHKPAFSAVGSLASLASYDQIAATFA